MEITKHFTATTFIVCSGKVLLHWHKRLHKWLPVGGHIDRDELPCQAAVREAKEEAGIDIQIYCTRSLQTFKDARELTPPAYLLLEDVNQFHQHIDFVYFAKSTTLVIGEGASEASTLRWFSEEDLCAEPEMPDDVLELGREAIKVLSEK